MKYSKTLFGDIYSTCSAFQIGDKNTFIANPDTTLRKNGSNYDAYRELKNDAHLWSCIQSRKSGVLALDYRVLQNKCSDAIYMLVKRTFEKIDLQSLIRDILEAPFFGYQPLEIVWDYDAEQIDRIIPIKISAKPQENFMFDRNGDILYHMSYAEPPKYPDKYKILDVRYEATHVNPYGHSLLSKCYWSVTFKKAALKYWVNFTERYGIPVLLGQYTRGSTTEEARELAEILSSMTEDSVIVTPADINIRFEEANKNSSVDLFRELIKYCNAEISKAVLSQTLTTELDMGSYAASQVHYKVRKEVILSDARLVEQALNSLIAYIVELNSNEKYYPSFNLIINDADNQWRVDRDSKLMNSSNFRFTKKYWMEVYGFNEDEIE